MFKTVFAVLAASTLAACEPAATVSGAAPNPTISTYVAAYNAQDLAGMVELMHPDIEWISLEESEAIVYTTGVEQLSSELEAHFARPSESTSELSNWSTTGPYISVTETIRPETAQPGDEVAASLSAYELQDGLIRRVWYYPAVNVALE